MSDIVPGALLESVRSGQVVLFLGAGASMDAVSDNGSTVPTGKDLAKALSSRFLGGEDSDRPLSVVAELAISDTDLITVQTYVRDLFAHFHPADFHQLVPTFRWSAIATTNYDLIIEEAYASTPKALQTPVPFLRNSDRVDSKMRNESALPFLKLHGCISKSEEIDVPLILTVDQYVTHKKGRDRLFARFKDYATEYPIVFVGHSLEDPDLRQVLMEVSTDDISRPRYWVIAPHSSPRQERFWESKKITSLQIDFRSFLLELDRRIDKGLRSVVIERAEHPIGRRFTKQALRASTELLQFLQSDVTYLHRELAALPARPKDFYKGYDSGWGSIQQSLDARRHITDTVLSDVVLVEEVDRPTKSDFYALRGHAGSGKTQALRRIAWESATTFGKLCLYANPGCRLSIQPISELVELAGERVFLFVDRPADVANDLTGLIRMARAKSLPLTVVCAERANEWNNDCGSLAAYANELFEVLYLSVQEIEWLIDKLTEHNSLGTLEGKPRDSQIKAFVESADKQLIVALHEATSGLPFRDIVYDEYTHIRPEQAQGVYLTICALNRLGVPVRAGLVKRIHGISFEQFKAKFFSPLESVVYAERYEPARDMAYRTRHPWIAEVVFERALPTARERHDLYMQIFAALDVGYDPDRKAYRGMLRARDLMQLLPDPLLVRDIYDATRDIAGDDPYHHQQRAIYEMRRDNPNLALAYEELQLAKRLAPHDKSIVHTLADLEMRRAQGADGSVERDRHLRAAQDLALSITGREADTSHGYRTICVIALERLQDQLVQNPDDQVSVSRLVKQVEQRLLEGLQRFPGDSYLADAEARLAKVIGQDQRAIRALERALHANTGNAFVVKALARLYEDQGDVAKARAVLEKCLEVARADKAVNGAFARLLTKYFPKEGQVAEQYWRRSFTEGDANFHNQFWYARQLYINGHATAARDLFRKLGAMPGAPDTKLEVKGLILDEEGRARRFMGSVQRLESSYAWLSRDGEPGGVFLHRSGTEPGFWETLTAVSRVSYELGFNHKGPAAVRPALLRLSSG